MADISVDVAVVGGGPSGLAAAVALRRIGIRSVLVLERDANAGGVPRHCGHPPFGLREFGRILTGPAYAARLVRLAQDAGVDLRTRHTVVRLGPGGVLTATGPDGAFTVTARRVLLATGVRETPRSARLVGGERPAGVLNTGALQASIHLEHLLPFRRPVIVGTELVAMSAISTCRASGIAPVAVVEGNARPTVRWPLGLYPHLVGVPVHYNTEIVDISGSDRVRSVTVRHADGTCRDIACDGVLFTGRFVPEAALARGSHLQVDPASGVASVDQFGRLSDGAYFAAGNVLHAVETAGWCFREGWRIGTALAADLADELPSSSQAITVEAGNGVAFVVPQRLTQPMGKLGLRDLQFRARGAQVGQVQARSGTTVLWRGQTGALPERRLLLPLSKLKLPPAPGAIELLFTSGPSEREVESA